MQRAEQRPYLTLDGGALLFEREKLAASREAQSLATADCITTAYRLMGYDAVGVARQDLAGGLAFLKKLQERAGFTWLSANLLTRSTQKPFFTPSLIKQVGDLQIGIIGLTGSARPAATSLFSADDDAEIVSWQKTLPGLAAELSKKCDMLILLSNYSFKQNEEIARTVPGIHLIIQAGTDTNNLPPQQVKNTLICRTDKQGKYLGRLQITWRQSKSWGDDTLKKILAGKVNEADGISYRLYRLRHRGMPPEELAKDKIFQNLNQKEKKILAEIKELDKKLKSQNPQGDTPSTYVNRFIAMDVDLPDQPDVLAIVEQVKIKVNKLGKKAARQAARTTTAKDVYPPGFTGWQGCAACHNRQAAFWKKTSHAGAYKTLLDKRRNYNLNCLPCHVTYDRDNKKNIKAPETLLTLPADLLQVGCEVCHNPGKRHKANPTKDNITRKPAVEVCRQCHTPEHDDNFDYERNIKLISCPRAMDRGRE